MTRCSWTTVGLEGQLELCGAPAEGRHCAEHAAQLRALIRSQEDVCRIRKARDAAIIEASRRARGGQCG